ncbi:MAG TPA: hypothetical protein VG826_17365 [Pirellulales bacterium]|nr:hypothetical protein [Pirellulales bacterium]
MSSEIAAESQKPPGEQEPAAPGGGNGDALKRAGWSAETASSALSIDAIVSELHRLSVDEVQPNWPRLNAEDRSKLKAAVRQLASATEEQAGTAETPGQPSTPSSVRPGRAFGVGIALASLWIVVFAVGFAVPALPHLNALTSAAEKSLSVPSALGHLILVVLCSTPTNPGLLACIAALLGGIANWIHVDGTIPSSNNVGASIQAACFASMLRGFFMYLALLAGLLLLTTQAITQATQEQYVQLAGTVSVFAFMVGYDPDVFKKLMGKVNGWAVQRENAETPAQPVSADNGASGRAQGRTATPKAPDQN